MLFDGCMHGLLLCIYLGVRFLGHRLHKYSALADSANIFLTQLYQLTFAWQCARGPAAHQHCELSLSF